MAAVTICSDFGAQENKICRCFYFFSFYLPWSDGTECQYLDFFFLILSFKPTFSLSSFTLIKRLFSSSWLSAIRVVSSAYLRLLIFFPAILILACNSSSPAFCMMYSVYKLNKQGDNKQPCHTFFFNPEPVSCSIQGSNCCFLTCIQISQEAGQVVWYSHLFKNFPQSVVTHTKALMESMKQKLMFFWNCLAFSVTQRMWSLVPLPFLNPVWTSESSWFTYCWSLA